MPRKEVPISVTRHITVNGIDCKECEFSEKEAKKMYAEMTENALKGLGYTPVKTA